MTEPETRSLVVEREMPHAPEKIWRALTESPLIDEWLMKNDFQPKVGHRFSFRTQPVANWSGVVDCEVLAVEKPRRLSYSWASMGVDQVVTWTLEPTAAGTRLRMEQSGFRADQKQAYGGAKYGWQNFLDKLERVLGGMS